MDRRDVCLRALKLWKARAKPKLFRSSLCSRGWTFTRWDRRLSRSPTATARRPTGRQPQSLRSSGTRDGISKSRSRPSRKRSSSRWLRRAARSCWPNLPTALVPAHPGDSTGVLKYLIKAPLTEAAAIYLVDPEAAVALAASGIGSTVTLSIGGKFDRKNSKPVRVTGRVRLISDGRWTARARGYNTGIETCMGTTVVFESGKVQILIAERSAMTVDPELFRSHGIDPAYCKIVVVKSPNGFRAAYEPIAKRIFLVDTPGVSTAKLENMPFKRINRPIYPLDRDLTYKA